MTEHNHVIIQGAKNRTLV